MQRSSFYNHSYRPRHIGFGDQGELQLWIALPAKMANKEEAAFAALEKAFPDRQRDTIPGWWNTLQAADSERYGALGECTFSLYPRGRIAPQAVPPEVDGQLARDGSQAFFLASLFMNHAPNLSVPERDTMLACALVHLSHCYGKSMPLHYVTAAVAPELRSAHLYNGLLHAEVAYRSHVEQRPASMGELYEECRNLALSNLVGLLTKPSAMTYGPAVLPAEAFEAMFGFGLPAKTGDVFVCATSAENAESFRIRLGKEKRQGSGYCADAVEMLVLPETLKPMGGQNPVSAEELLVLRLNALKFSNVWEEINTLMRNLENAGTYLWLNSETPVHISEGGRQELLAVQPLMKEAAYASGMRFQPSNQRPRDRFHMRIGFDAEGVYVDTGDSNYIATLLGRFLPAGYEVTEEDIRRDRGVGLLQGGGRLLVCPELRRNGNLSIQQHVELFLGVVDILTESANFAATHPLAVSIGDASELIVSPTEKLPALTKLVRQEVCNRFRELGIRSELIDYRPELAAIALRLVEGFSNAENVEQAHYWRARFEAFCENFVRYNTRDGQKHPYLYLAKSNYMYPVCAAFEIDPAEREGLSQEAWQEKIQGALLKNPQDRTPGIDGKQ